tara:strand:+ start:99 stop:422 length:324 start_codon:yes stop_codon:yes gene_type:complete
MEDKIKDLLTRNARTNLFNELNRIRLAKELNELFINETDIAKSKKAVTNKPKTSTKEEKVVKEVKKEETIKPPKNQNSKDKKPPAVKPKKSALSKLGKSSRNFKKGK